MAKGKKVGKVKDKWREKTWALVEAPRLFNNAVVAYVPITESEKAIGRVVETTLYDILRQDPKQYNTKLYFEIVKIEGEKAHSILKGHEYSREYLRSLTRRGSSMVNFIDDYTTKDGTKVRVYTVAFTQGRINSSRKHAIRLATRKVLSEKTQTLTYEEFATEVVHEKCAQDVYNEAKKIIHLRHVGIKKTKLIGTVRDVSMTEKKVMEREAEAEPNEVEETETEKVAATSA